MRTINNCFISKSLLRWITDSQSKGNFSNLKHCQWQMIAKCDDDDDYNNRNGEDATHHHSTSFTATIINNNNYINPPSSWDRAAVSSKSWSRASFSTVRRSTLWSWSLPDIFPLPSFWPRFPGRPGEERRGWWCSPSWPKGRSDCWQSLRCTWKCWVHGQCWLIIAIMWWTSSATMPR